MTMGITVAAVSLSNKDTVENIYFDSNLAHNLIMDFNPQYGAYLTEEGIRQLEEFEPIPLDTTDHSGNGNDLKSATLIGVMADKYSMISLVEVKFNKDISVPENNVAILSGGKGGGVGFRIRTTEDEKIKYDNSSFYGHQLVPQEKVDEELRRPINYIESEDKQTGMYIANEFLTNVYIVPVADKPNTAIIFIEDNRANRQCSFEKNSTVRYTLEELFTINEEMTEYDVLADATYIFDIPTPKKLISSEKIKVNDEFTYRDCVYNIKSVEHSQSYVEIKYTCELTPDFYERLEHKGNADMSYDYEVTPPRVKIINDDGRNVPTGIKWGNAGAWMPYLYTGKEFPPFNPDTVHTAVICFEKPQNDESVGKLVFYDSSWDYKGKELLTIPLK